MAGWGCGVCVHVLGCIWVGRGQRGSRFACLALCAAAWRAGSPTPRPALRLQIGQLLAIFQLLGTPGELEWPGVSSLPDWSCHFPQWRPRDLAEVRCAAPRFLPQLDSWAAN